MSRLSLLFICLLVFPASVFSNQKFSTEIWKHQANDLENISNFKGLEIDCYFVSSLNKIIISHQDSFNSLTAKKLEEEIIPKNKNVWLDFKNFGKLNSEEINTAMSQLSKFENQFFLESQNFFKLYKINKRYENIRTIFNLPIFFENKFYIQILSKVFNFSSFDFISISNHQFNLVKDYFQSEKIFVYTINNKKNFCNFVKKNKVKVILSRYNFNQNKCK